MLSSGVNSQNALGEFGNNERNCPNNLVTVHRGYHFREKKEPSENTIAEWRKEEASNNCTDWTGADTKHRGGELNSIPADKSVGQCDVTFLDLKAAEDTGSVAVNMQSLLASTESGGSECPGERYMDPAHLHSPWRRVPSRSPEAVEEEAMDDWVRLPPSEKTRRDSEAGSRARERSVEDLSGRYSEILVYEGDTDSDAGSEDVELLPHRYHGGGAGPNTHLYVNKLSLAAELLRTKESLPYDDDFKLVVDESRGAVPVGEVAYSKRRPSGTDAALPPGPAMGVDNPAFVVEDDVLVKKQLLVKHSGEYIVKVADEPQRPLEKGNNEEEALWKSEGRYTKGYRRLGGRPRENSPLLPLYASTILNCPCCVLL